MKIGIMQPYFFPYLGYFSLIKHTDRFILFDPVQFIKHGWIERNRILKQGGWTYVAVPLQKHTRETIIKDILIRPENWQDKLLAQMTFYKKRAPFYNQTLDVVKQGISCSATDITQLNAHVLQTVCDYLGINFKAEIFSKMQLEIEAPTAPDEWALNICKALGNVDSYWNPPGGITFFDRDKYQKAGINLVFQKINLQPYSQRGLADAFVPGLSIIDVMMFNSPEEINKMLDNYNKL